MDAQLSFASLDFASKKKRTKRDVFLAEMAVVVPWQHLEADKSYMDEGVQILELALNGCSIGRNRAKNAVCSTLYY